MKLSLKAKLMLTLYITIIFINIVLLLAFQFEFKEIDGHSSYVLFFLIFDLPLCLSCLRLDDEIPPKDIESLLLRIAIYVMPIMNIIMEYLIYKFYY